MRRGAKPTKPKAGAKSSVARKSAKEGSRVRDLEKRLAEALHLKTEALKREAEALEQQTATADILKVISSSPTDTQSVFDAIAQNAARLCRANDAQVLRVEGEMLRLMTAVGAPSMPSLRRLSREHVVGRAVIDRRTIHVHDLQLALAQYPESTAARFGVHSVLAVPLLREDVALGVIRISRTEVRPFTDEQIGLLQTFADQAVIAIENARLFAELQRSNRELTTALDTQTATGDILRVISRSQTDVQPVFDAIVQSAARLLRADAGALTRVAGEQLELAAFTSTDETGDAAMRASYPRPLSFGGAQVEALRTRAPVNVPDTEADPRRSETLRATARARGYRSVVAVPLLRQGEAIGTIAVSRRAPGGFTDDETALLQTFADQAVIAIENVRLFRELADKSQQLEAASRHKSEFLANMSHELRTPLNAIIGYSELLEEDAADLDGGRLVPDLQKIATAAKHQLSLINDILDLSKVEAGRMELGLSEFDLTTTLDSALTLVRERAGRRGIALQIEVDSGVGPARADERKVRQVVLNLLSNAIKFTPEGGRIEVRAARKDRSVEVSVADTGVGIAPEDQEKVFEEFRQVGTADKKVEGTGLGLALARRFVELHGGRIWVDSEVGRGSTFTFSLPVGGGG